MEQDELGEILDLLRDKTIKFGNLMFKVYDVESGKEGWVRLAELLNILDGEKKE